MKHAGTDGRRAAVGARPGQHRSARAGLREAGGRAVIGDHRVDNQAVGAEVLKDQLAAGAGGAERAAVWRSTEGQRARPAAHEDAVDPQGLACRMDDGRAGATQDALVQGIDRRDGSAQGDAARAAGAFDEAHIGRRSFGDDLRARVAARHIGIWCGGDEAVGGVGEIHREVRTVDSGP